MVADPPGAEGAAFAQALSALKDRGSNLLVVGAAVDGTHRRACDRLLGETGELSRRRLRVQVDGDCSGGTCEAREFERILADGTDRRSTATPEASDATAPRARVASGDPGALAAAVVEAIEEIDADAGGLSPAELRVCFDSLVPVLADHDEEQVFRTLAPITNRIRAVDGMGHFHLQVAAGDRYVTLLEPLFDAVIAVRTCDGRAEHRWRLVEENVRSGWLPL